MEDAIHLIYYVNNQNVPTGAEEGVLVWKTSQTNYNIDTAGYTKILWNNETFEYNSVTYKVFYFNNFVVKECVDDFYAVSYVKVDDTYYYSAPDKYSVLQYCINKQSSDGMKTGGIYNMGELATEIRNYVAKVQGYLGYKVDKLATADFVEITLANAVFSDGFKYGLYKVGSELTVTPSMPEAVFNGWYNGSNLVSNDYNYTFTVSESIELTAKNGIIDTLNNQLKFKMYVTVGYNSNSVSLTNATSGYILDYEDNPVTNSTSMVLKDTSGNPMGEVTWDWYDGDNNVVTSVSTSASGKYTLTGHITSNATGIDGLTPILEYEVCPFYTKTDSSDPANPFIEVSGYYGPGGEVYIPGYLNGIIVKKLGQELFKDDAVTTVTMADTITTLAYKCFSQLSTNRTITSITLSNSISDVGQLAFEYTKITTITLPATLTHITDRAFSACTLLETVNVLADTITIGVEAFATCLKLDTISGYNNVTSIGDNAFYKVPLKSINLNGLESIGQHVFYQESQLTTITIPGTLKNAGSGESIIFECYTLKEVIFEEGVETIGAKFLQSCPNVERIVIPSTVTSIGYNALRNTLKVYMYDNGIVLGEYNFYKAGCVKYYYNENPTVAGYYWHYDTDGKTIIEEVIA